jgi:hypothetical protein
MNENIPKRGGNLSFSMHVVGQSILRLQVADVR